MERRRQVKFQAPSAPPRIEFDPSVMAWYVRLKSVKVAKTISEDTGGHVYAIDLDERGEVIGFELLGVKEFSITMLSQVPLIDFSKTDFSRAKFVPSTRGDLVPA